MAKTQEQTESPEITRAAERYLEQYGEPMVMNTYLKITVLVLAAICFMLGALIFKSQKALANQKPFIVRVNDVGRAEAIDYRNYEYKPQEAENKYYLSRWATLFFQRNRYTIERDQTASLYFLNSDVQQAVIRREQQEKTIATFQADSTLPYVDIDVRNVILDDLKQSPYSARIEFDKVFTNSTDHTPLKVEHWTVSVTYVFAEQVKNDALQVNPLGLTIVRYRADQAFGDPTQQQGTAGVPVAQ
jgi:type IV secretory pathway TrbF-like protein